YGKPSVAWPWKAGRFSGQDFGLQPDGTLSCPAGKTLHPTEQRREADGSLRVLYSVRIRDCRGCPLGKQCQWHGEATTKPRRINVLCRSDWSLDA
ncbi:MAG: transposase, partial [Ktedonobacteraceae bacterium]